jgi:ribosomal protein S18 acetylase RimI-like enzyme
MTIRLARRTDIPAMAEIRAADWGTEEYWRERILQYLTHQLHPREALRPRVSFVAVDQDRVVGLIAGHLTRRFGCDGELEWISVRPQYRRRGVAAMLIGRLAAWFVRHKALQVCVDVEPSNEAARSFYARHGAEDLKPHWMVWKDIRRAIPKPRARRTSG